MFFPSFFEVLVAETNVGDALFDPTKCASSRQRKKKLRDVPTDQGTTSVDEF